MPYLGLDDGEEVLPPHVERGETVNCPACGNRMSVVKSHERRSTFVSRHFSHMGGAENSGGDSPESGICNGEERRIGSQLNLPPPKGNPFYLTGLNL